MAESTKRIDKFSVGIVIALSCMVPCNFYHLPPTTGLNAVPVNPDKSSFVHKSVRADTNQLLVGSNGTPAGVGVMFGAPNHIPEGAGPMFGLSNSVLPEAGLESPNSLQEASLSPMAEKIVFHQPKSAPPRLPVSYRSPTLLRALWPTGTEQGESSAIAPQFGETGVNDQQAKQLKAGTSSSESMQPGPSGLKITPKSSVPGNIQLLQPSSVGAYKQYGTSAFTGPKPVQPGSMIDQNHVQPASDLTVLTPIESVSEQGQTSIQSTLGNNLKPVRTAPPGQKPEKQAASGTVLKSFIQSFNAIVQPTKSRPVTDKPTPNTKGTAGFIFDSPNRKTGVQPIKPTTGNIAVQPMSGTNMYQPVQPLSSVIRLRPKVRGEPEPIELKSDRTVSEFSESNSGRSGTELESSSGVDSPQRAIAQTSFRITLRQPVSDSQPVKSTAAYNITAQPHQLARLSAAMKHKQSSTGATALPVYQAVGLPESQPTQHATGAFASQLKPVQAATDTTASQTNTPLSCATADYLANSVQKPSPLPRKQKTVSISQQNGPIFTHWNQPPDPSLNHMWTELESLLFDLLVPQDVFIPVQEPYYSYPSFECECNRGQNMCSPDQTYNGECEDGILCC